MANYCGEVLDRFAWNENPIMPSGTLSEIAAKSQPNLWHGFDSTNPTLYKTNSMTHTFRFSKDEGITLEQSENGMSFLSSTIDNDYDCPNVAYAAATNTLESFILAAVNAGIPVDDKFRDAVQTTFDAIINNYGDE